MPFDVTGQGIGAKRRKRSDEIDLTSLIDVVFLLLIFFMVSSTMTGQADVKVPAAKNQKGIDPRQSVVITIRQPRTLGGGTTIIIGDGIGPEGSLDDVRSVVEKGIKQGLTQVIIKAERRVPHIDVLEVAKVVGSIEGGRLYIGVQELH